MSVRYTQEKREFTGWHMLGVLVAFFGTVIAVNLTLAFFAVHTWTGLVVNDSYLAGQSFNEDAEKARKQDALGLSGDLVARPAGLEFHFADAAGQPIIVDKVTVKIGRPAVDRQDRVIELHRVGGGHYRADTELAPGVWLADLTAKLDDGSEWLRHWRLVVGWPEGRTR